MATDVNSLFQTCGIEDIKTVERKIRGEIEKKKEELRVMVGERYRDLINAADTIQDMRNGTEEILSGIAQVSNLCSGFAALKQEKNEEEKSSRLSNQGFYTLATQMDLLVDTPEQIWGALDTHQFLLAAHLYLLSQHIVNSSLNIQSGSLKTSGKPDVFGARTALKDATLPDKSLAESLCCISLLDNLSPRQVFTEFLMARKAAIQDVFHPSMHSISVKKQICDITHIVRLTLQQMVVLFYNTDDQEKSDIKPLFYEMLLDVSAEKSEKSPRALQSLFGRDVDVLTVSRYLPPSVAVSLTKGWTRVKGLEFNAVQEISDLFRNYNDERTKDILFRSLHTVNFYLSSLCLRIFRFEPEIMPIGFAPKLRSVPISISISYIQKHAVEWLNGCMKDIQEGVKNLLSFVNHIKGLASIRDAVYELLQTKQNNETDEVTQKSWEEYCQICLNRSLSVWNELFQPLFIERAKLIIEKHTGKCFTHLKDSLLNVLESLTDTGNTLDESIWDQNITSYQWHEFPQDFSNIFNTNDSSKNEDILSLKVKYYTPTIKRLCVQFNNNLQNLLVDVRYMICEEDNDDGLDEQERKLRAIKDDVRKLIFDSDDNSTETSPEPFSKYADAELIKTLLSSVFIQQVEHFCKETVKANMISLEEGLTQKKNEVDVTANINKVTFLSRFCLSVPDLCYNIHRTIDFESNSISRPQVKRQLSHLTPRKRLSKKHENVEKIETLLNEQSQYGFELWAKWICNSCQTSTRMTLDSTSDFFGTTSWEAIDIVEENEKGEKVKSKIRIPSQTSFYLSSLLHSVTEEFHRVGAAVIDKSLMTSLTINLGQSIIKSHQDYLESVGKDEKQQVYQNHALQMIFDVKFIAKLFGGGGGGANDSLAEKLSMFKQSGTKLINKLESFVDPFDLDVIMPHLNSFVQRHIQRSLLIYGSISNTEKHITPPRLSTTTHEDHSVVQLVPNPPRFMLLPVSSHKKDDGIVELATTTYNDEFISPIISNEFRLSMDFTKAAKVC